MKRTIVAILLVLAIVAAVPRKTSARPAAEAPKVIDITAKRFEFTPNAITLKKGEPVVLRLKTEDVTHGFFARALKIDELIEPGKTVEVALQPAQAGTFTVICHHFCGAGHGNMKMTITVVE